MRRFPGLLIGVTLACQAASAWAQAPTVTIPKEGDRVGTRIEVSLRATPGTLQVIWTEVFRGDTGEKLRDIPGIRHVADAQGNYTGAIAMPRISFGEMDAPLYYVIHFRNGPNKGDPETTVKVYPEGQPLPVTPTPTPTPAPPTPTPGPTPPPISPPTPPPGGTRATSQPPPSPGAVLTEQVIGPAGGTVAVGTDFRVTFPAGALDREEKITIRGAADPQPAGPCYFVEREGGEGLLAPPAQIAWVLPAGLNPTHYCPLQQVDENWWGTLAHQYDPTTRTYTAEVYHFSGEWLADMFSYQTWVKIGGGAQGAGVYATGHALLAIGGVVGIGAVSWPALIVCTAVGAATAVDRNEAAKRAGLEGRFTVRGFDIYWNKDDFSASDGLVVIYDEAGKMYTLVKYKPAAGAAPAAIDWGKINPREFMKGKKSLWVPGPILGLASILQYVAARYDAAGYAVPESVPVLVGGAVDPTQDGLWDGATLNLKWESVYSLKQWKYTSKSEEKARRLLMVSCAHEYWHALWSLSEPAFQESFCGANECFAVTYENVIFPGCDAFLDNYGWKTTAQPLANGLAEAGEGETASNRGYHLWPFGKWLYWTQGDDAVRLLSSGSADKAVLAGLFRRFTEAMVAKDKAPPDPGKVLLPNGQALDSATAWSSFVFLEMVNAPVGHRWKLGGNDFPLPPPLSLRFVLLQVPPDPAAGPGTIVVRREERIAEEELIALAPTYGLKIEMLPSLDKAIWSKGGLAVSEAAAGTGTGAVNVPMAILFQRGTVPGTEVPFLAYRLSPPRQLKVAAVPAAEGEEARLAFRFQPPVPGGSLTPADAYAGYRLCGKTKEGGVEPVADYLFNKGTFSTPTGWYASTLGQHEIIEDTAGEVQIEQAKVARYVDLGLATIDGMMRNGEQPLLSAIVWKGGAGTQKVTGRVCKREDEIQPGEGGPMGTLEGVPLPGVEVAYEYTAQGKVIQGTVKTDAKGYFALEAPPGATVKLTARGETKTVTVVAGKPATVNFGGQGHDPTKDPAIDPTQLPRGDS